MFSISPKKKHTTKSIKTQTNKYDTGVKLTVMVVIREYNKLETEDKTRFKLYLEENEDPEVIDFKKGDIVVIQSRKVSMEFEKHFEKTFYVCSNISGPLKPHE